MKEMQIEVMSREKVLAHAKKPWQPNTALVSIYDSDDVPPTFEHYPAHKCYLCFDDVPLDIADELEFSMDDFIAFDDALAEKLAKFIHARLTDGTQLLVCHCEHGQSRSAAVAAAVAEYLNKGGGKKYFEDERYTPHKTVYTKTLAALKKG